MKVLVLVAVLVSAVFLLGATTAKASVMPPGKAFINTGAPTHTEQVCAVAFVAAFISGPFGGWTGVRSVVACTAAVISSP